MQRTLSKLLTSQCRSRILHVATDLIPIETTVLTDEFCCRRLHCLLNASSLARNDSEAGSFSDTTQPAKEISKWWVDYTKRKNYKERCVSRISNCLQCSEYMSQFLIDADQLTFLDKIDSTLKTIEYLMEQGISSECIRKNIAILRFSDSELQLRIKCMKTWGLDQQYFGEFLPVLKLEISNFLTISNHFVKERRNSIPDGNRMIHFAKLLGCSLMATNRAFIRCRSLYRSDFDKIKSSLECYLEFGVKPEFILRDITGLKADVEIIKLRLSELFQKGLQPLRPNLVTCTDFMYKRKCRELEKKVNYYAPYKNLDEYLTSKLFSNNHHVSADKKRKILLSLEALNAKNVKNILEFLQEEKFTSIQICNHLHIFSYDVSTLRERYDMLKKIGIRSPSITVLTKKEDDFEEFIGRTGFNVREKKQIIAEMAALVADAKR